METYPNLPTPAGRWAAACACGQPAALVHDGRVWCVSCHVADLRTPRELPQPAYVPLPRHEAGRAIRRRPASRAHLRDEHQGYG